jgi:hypothetical protein
MISSRLIEKLVEKNEKSSPVLNSCFTTTAKGARQQEEKTPR